MKRGIFKIKSSEMTVGVMAARDQRAAAHPGIQYTNGSRDGATAAYVLFYLFITIHQEALFSYEHNEKIQNCESNEKKLGHQLINPENLG